MKYTNDAYIAQTRCWLENVVLKHNLCPFAHKPFQGGQIRYVVTDSARPEFLLEDLQRELEHLRATPAADVETTLLIHPGALEDFLDYNDFLDVVDALLVAEGYEGEFQVASFHPDYQFADTRPNDAENYTNRSPWPMLHLIREHSLEQAIASHPDVDAIPERNIQTMNALGAEHHRKVLENCLQTGTESK
ncbi:DUF1415 domain-containing protein [Candidatus Thiothrix sp. Deng01]|uniref:DUF1415 domain-containing protein n=1 Tax=Candidatus Thiothrix phosphatis TaxID=3112415 RepID=A0ABU6CVU2_9GAMM|nr:DUF1415 domain-containing protein [Candidatus Thiothrix sp. Deng01]MEB4590657.1 DUF1415 domain-containing protein [Candidatus Thiothrix sp. Deng01]